MLSVLALCAASFNLLAQQRVEESPPFDGFITRITSPNEFEVGTAHIACSTKTIFQITALDGHTRTPFPSTDLHVGQPVEIEGKFSNGIVAATRVLVPVDFSGTEDLNGSGFVTPSQQNDLIWVEGYPLHITADTVIHTSEGKPATATDLKSMTWISYQAVRGPETMITATELVLYPTLMGPAELKFRTSHKLQITMPDYKAAAPGIAMISKRTIYILPDSEAQDWITRIGTSLIPQTQKDLPDTDQDKLSFQFLIVDHTECDDTCTIDSPDGTILVPVNLILDLHNEAELAEILANAIAFTVERYDYLDHNQIALQNWLEPAKWVGLIASWPLAVAAQGTQWVNGDPLKTLNSKADRIGLTYMLAAGYDISQAPYAYEEGSASKDTNPRRKETKPPAEPTALMRDLAFDYRDLHFVDLKRNEEEYARISVQLRAADAAARAGTAKKKSGSAPDAKSPGT